MPKIFDNETREDIRGQMLDNGYSLIKRFGLKKTTIEDVTRSSGVAKGTFYNFFKTKEEFIYQIVVYKRKLIRERNMEMIAANGGIVDRRLMRSLLYFIISGDYNLLTYLSRDDIAMLAARWPKEYMDNASNDEKMFSWIFDKVVRKSADCDWKVFMNLYKIAILGLSEIDQLNAEVLDETVAQVVESMLDYVFEEARVKLAAIAR